MQNTAAANNSKSLAYRFQSSVDLKDVSDGALEGQIGAYFEHYDRGYSGQILQDPNETDRWGVSASFGNSDNSDGWFIDVAARF